MDMTEEIEELRTTIKELEKRINIIEEERHMDYLRAVEERVSNIEKSLIKKKRFLS